MSYVIYFVKTFPGMSVAIGFLVVLLPIIIELVQFVLRLKGAM